MASAGSNGAGIPAVASTGSAGSNGAGIPAVASTGSAGSNGAGIPAVALAFCKRGVKKLALASSGSGWSTKGTYDWPREDCP